jgi:signal transduction histidine kinase
MKFLKQIHTASIELNKSLDPNITHRITLTTACEITGADFGSIYLRTSKNTLRRAYSNIPKKNRIRSRTEGNTYKAFETKKPIYISEQKLLEIHPESKDKDIKNIMIIPLVLDDEALGVLTLLSKKIMSYGTQAQQKLDLFASMASLAIHNSYIYQQMQDSINERDLFISMASHELKTPLTSISGYAQISMNRLKKDKPVTERHIQRIIQQVNRLNQTITDFLSVENVRTGQLPYNFSEVSLLDVIESAISGFKMNHPDYQIVTEFQPINTYDDIWIWGDFYKLTQVVTNILNNAGKHAPKGSSITISAIEASDSAKIIITDEGPGIDDSEKYKIFNLFYRSSQNSEEAGGKGIGLFLAKQIVSKHNGKIWVESSNSRGAQFVVELPISSSESDNV